MSIIIEGIDLPTTPKKIVIYPSGNVDEYVLNELIQTDCQAIQIPTPHGRLIDADALDLEREVDLADDWKTAHEISNCVRYAPTILEAEE